MIFWRKNSDNKSTDDKTTDNQNLDDKAEKDAVAPEVKPEIEPVLEAEAEAKTEAASEPPPPPAEAAAAPPPVAEESWLSRMTFGLAKSTGKITQGLSDLLTKKKLDQDMLDELEELLITADLGPKTAQRIVWEFSKDRFGKDISEEEIRLALAESMAEILKPVAKPLEIAKPAAGPFVILVCGVNGAGKTTTIGKLAHDFSRRQGKSVMLAAGDTFRAAAIEQLKIWAERVGCPILAKDIGADAAAVAYEAYEQAVSHGADVLMIDTAGRLQNKQNLMAELEKIIRVLKKREESLPHAVLLVLDATTGQNAFSQVETFLKMVNVTGLVVTKLDGTAKGGVLVGLADQFGLPVHAIGVGEKIGDLSSFDAGDFANSLVGVPKR